MTEALVAPDRRADRPTALAKAARDLLRTTGIYLSVALVSGASYALCAIAINGGAFVRLWLASVVPIALFLIARSLLLVYRRRHSA